LFGVAWHVVEGKTHYATHFTILAYGSSFGSLGFAVEGGRDGASPRKGSKSHSFIEAEGILGKE
jgi:hypothetical protein